MKGSAFIAWCAMSTVQDGRASQAKRWSSVLSEDDIGRSADSGYELGSSLASSVLAHDR